MASEVDKATPAVQSAADPHDGAGADPHDERMRGRELIAVWCALLLASWTFVAAVVVGLRMAWRAIAG